MHIKELISITPACRKFALRRHQLVGLWDPNEMCPSTCTGLQSFKCALKRSACTYLCALSPPAADPRWEVWEVVCLFLILIAFLLVHQTHRSKSQRHTSFPASPSLLNVMVRVSQLMKNKLLCLFDLFQSGIKPELCSTELLSEVQKTSFKKGKPKNGHTHTHAADVHFLNAGINP